MAPSTPIAIASPKKLGTLRRWNSILSPDHRRSQSLNSMHKSTSIEALRSTTSLGTFRPRDDEQSSIASSNTEAIVEEDDDNYEGSIVPSASISPTRSPNRSRQSFSTSPAPPRPAPAPKLWDETPSSATLQGLETPVPPTRALPPVPNTQPAVISESPNTIVSKFSTWKEKSFAGRRKGSVPDLELGSDKTTKAFNPDSPSLPPIYSARTESTIMTLGTITPRPITNDLTLPETNDYSSLRTPEWQERDQKRASSMLLPSSLAPIVIPSIPARIPPVPPIDTTMVNNATRNEERPPRPPPKSPRTLLRAFPIPKSAQMPGRHTANSSINSISPVETPSTAATTWSPVSAYTASTVASPDAFARSPPKFNTVTFEESSRTVSFSPNIRNMPNLKHGRSYSNTHSEQQRPPRKSSASSALGNHSRMVSEASIIHRGRPMKRGEPLVFQKTPIKTSQATPVNSQFTDLPQGLRKSQAGYIPLDELHGLRRDAEDRASDYHILTQRQIADLDQEQHFLDESCDQMQHTIKGLKEARKATHLSLRLYLDASNAATFSREYIAKQTKTLHDLDLQIDEWQKGLNTANVRKAAIQSKVWQHLAAVLTAGNLAAEAGRPEEQTPPRSPERIIRRSFTENPITEDAILNDFEHSPRNDIESITVFADSGVANLLKSIEEELDVIDQARYYHGDETMI